MDPIMNPRPIDHKSQALSTSVHCNTPTISLSSIASSTGTANTGTTGGGKRARRNLDNDYENMCLQSSNTSEAIPVEKLRWYTLSNSDLIYKQYEVSVPRSFAKTILRLFFFQD